MNPGERFIQLMQKVERAQLLTESCDRAVVKTLRGWLMSIPLGRAGDDPASGTCKDADRYPARPDAPA